MSTVSLLDAGHFQARLKVVMEQHHVTKRGRWVLEQYAVIYKEMLWADLLFLPSNSFRREILELAVLNTLYAFTLPIISMPLVVWGSVASAGTVLKTRIVQFLFMALFNLWNVVNGEHFVYPWGLWEACAWGCLHHSLAAGTASRVSLFFCFLSATVFFPFKCWAFSNYLFCWCPTPLNQRTWNHEHSKLQAYTPNKGKQTCVREIKGKDLCIDLSTLYLNCSLCLVARV